MIIIHGIGPISIICSLVAIAQLYLCLFKENQKLNKILLCSNSAIVFIISVFMMILIISEKKKDICFEDLRTVFENTENGTRLIIQKNLKGTRAKLVSYDLGFIRKSENIDLDSIPKGKWFAYTKTGRKFATIDIDEKGNKKIIDGNSENQIIVKTRKDIDDNLDRENISFLFDRKIYISSPILLDNCKNISFEIVPDFLKNNNTQAGLFKSSKECIIIKNSENIRINGICVSGKDKEAIVKIIDSRDINIQEIKLIGFGNNGINIDSLSKEIRISDIEFDREIKHGIIAYSHNIDLNNIQKYTSSSDLGHRVIVLKDVKFDKKYLSQMLDKALTYYGKEDEKANSLKYNNVYCDLFKGNISDMFGSLRIVNAGNYILKNNYTAEETAKYSYAQNILEWISGEPLFLPDAISSNRLAYRAGNNGRFSFANPELFDYLSNNFIPKANTKISQYSYQQIYNSVFRKIARDYYSIYKQWKQNDSKTKLLSKSSKYIEFKDKGNYANMNNFLYYTHISKIGLKTRESFYDDEIVKDKGEYYQNANISEWDTYIELDDNEHLNLKNYANILSFWLRRDIDGSANSIFKFLKNILNTYDKSWIEKQ
ncbi:MAG: hypothetical protein N4A49_09275 [Marinifilaceae bacterium]|jgi:hypothetical protein|nr:hypothetical protein [Marinifilaceae bacterium]